MSTARRPWITSKAIWSGLAAHREEIRKWMTAAEHVDSIEVSYPALIDDPLSVIPALVEFLGGERLPHPERIPLVVDAALYRQRQVPQAQLKLRAGGCRIVLLPRQGKGCSRLLLSGETSASHPARVRSDRQQTREVARLRTTTARRSFAIRRGRGTEPRQFSFQAY